MKTLRKGENVEVLLIYLKINSKLMNLILRSEILLRLLTCLYRSDACFRLTASSPFKIKSNRNIVTYSEMLMTFYKMTRGTDCVDISKVCLEHLMSNLFWFFRQLSQISSCFCGQSVINSNVNVV